MLIFTATYGAGPRAETVGSVSRQRISVQFDHEVSYHNPFPGERNYANVIAQYQRAWQMALDGGYDALLTLEHDMVLPDDAVEKLYETDAPVVYGVYMLRHGTKTLNAWQHVGRRNVGMSLSLYPRELRRYRARGWGEVSGTGWGCTLIRREVLQRIRVRQSGDKDAGDIAFSTDCLRAGIKMLARFDVPCLHIEPDGNVLHPFEPTGGIVRRVYALQDVTCQSDGQTIVMKKGRYYSVNPAVGDDLARAGYVRITNDDEGERETADAEPVAEKAVAPKQRRVKKA